MNKTNGETHTTTYAHNMKVVLLIFCFMVAALSVWGAYRYSQNLNLLPTTKQTEGVNLSAVFDLQSKASTTKMFYSEKLGVGFTYDPQWMQNNLHSNQIIAIKEEGNKIYIDGRMIEVLHKDPNLSLQDTIRQFLNETNANDCIIGGYPERENDQRGYQYARIKLSTTTDAQRLFFDENVTTCPEHYTAFNSIKYFIFNPQIPDKYLFVDLGQAMLTTDGRKGFDWSSSIQILK